MNARQHLGHIAGADTWWSQLTAFFFCGIAVDLSFAHLVQQRQLLSSKDEMG